MQVLDWNAILMQVFMAFAGQYKILLGIGFAYGLIMWIFWRVEQFFDDGGKAEALRKAQLREWVAGEMDFRKAEQEIRVLEAKYEDEKQRQEFLYDLYSEREEQGSRHYFDADGNIRWDEEKPADYLEDLERNERSALDDTMLNWDEGAGSLYDPKPVHVYEQKSNSVLHYEDDPYSLRTKQPDSNGMYDPFESRGDEWWSSDREDD